MPSTPSPRDRRPAAVGAPAEKQSFTFDITGKTRANMGYDRRTFHFRSLSPTATLGFSGTTGSGYGAVIDDVKITAAVPSLCKDEEDKNAGPAEGHHQEPKGQGPVRPGHDAGRM